jgi:hypothetical protein
MCSQKVHFINASRELFISEVQGRLSLWNDRHPDYKKTEKKTNCGMKLELFLYIFQLGIDNII